jgi:hypothetical protein
LVIPRKKELPAKIALELKRRKKEKKHKTLDAQGIFLKELEDFGMGKISISDDWLGKPL